MKSDNGPAFASHEFAQFAKKYDFVHQKSTPLHPESNGGAERTVQLNNKAIRAAIVEGSNWKDTIAKRVDIYNETPHSSTKFTPNELLSNQSKNKIFPCFKSWKSHKTTYETARANDAKAKQNMKAYFDAKKATKHREFKLNDPVIVKWDRSSKFDAFFDPHAYRIVNINGSMITAKRSDKEITRNAKYFKQINEQCYANSMARLERLKPKVTRFYIAIKKMRKAAANNNLTPPPTPMPPQHQMLTRSRAKQPTTNDATPQTTTTRKTKQKKTAAQETTTTAQETTAATQETTVPSTSKDQLTPIIEVNEAQEATTSDETNKYNTDEFGTPEATTPNRTSAIPEQTITTKTTKTLRLFVPEFSDDSNSASEQDQPKQTKLPEKNPKHPL